MTRKLPQPQAGSRNVSVARLLVKLEQSFPLAFDPVEFRPQVVEKQRPDELEDVLFRGVVRAEVAPLSADP